MTHFYHRRLTMKIKYSIVVICIIILLISCVNIPDNKEDKLVDELEKVAFKTGAIYALKAKEDKRHSDCKTWGDLAELAWKIYNEEK